MRPNRLAEAVERIQLGASQQVTLAEFVDTFDLAPTVETRYVTIMEEPALTNDKKLGPAEFASRDVFTEERPLRRARGPQFAGTPEHRFT